MTWERGILSLEKVVQPDPTYFLLNTFSFMDLTQRRFTLMVLTGVRQKQNAARVVVIYLLSPPLTSGKHTSSHCLKVEPMKVHTAGCST